MKFIDKVVFPRFLECFCRREINNEVMIHLFRSKMGEVLGETWFAVEAKTFEISIEEKNKKLRGCIWERCKGATSWVRFGESSLQRLLLGIEDCDMISRKQEWFAN